MTTREIKIVNWIACEGLDNSEWGVHINSSDRFVSELFDVEIGGADLCPDKHLYVWVDNDTANRMKIQLGYENVKPDAEYLATDEETTVLLFDISE